MGWEPPAANTKKGWSRRRKIVVGGVAAFVILGGIGAAMGGETDVETGDAAALPTTATSEQDSVVQAPVVEATATEAVATETTATDAPAPVTQQAPAAPSLTTSQQNAVRSGEAYLAMTGMSKQGLIGQLSSEYGDGYSVEDATVAVNHIEQQGDVDWNEEAVQAGKAYLDMTGMSRSGLIQQLTSDAGDQFTVEQANYAADQLGL
jgi:hypothetical protein